MNKGFFLCVCVKFSPVGDPVSAPARRDGDAGAGGDGGALPGARRTHADDAALLLILFSSLSWRVQQRG